jgi:glycosyltransferase involved in cell wall biosynthesis
VVQRLDVIIKAAAQMPNDSRVLFVLVGDGVDRERLERASQEAQLSNVRFLGRQSFEMMPQFLNAADVLLVHLKRTPISDYLVPAKVLTYLAAGRPLLVAMEGPAADLVSTVGAGVVVPPETPEALAAAAEQLSRMREDQLIEMGRAGREHLLTGNSPASVIDEYERMLLNVADGERGQEAAHHRC